MARILLIGVDQDYHAAIDSMIGDPDVEIESIPDQYRAFDWLQHNRAELFAVAIGPLVDSPVRLAQQIHRLDREIAVLILVEEGGGGKVNRAVQFAPFLSDLVEIQPRNDVSAVAGRLRESIAQGSRRRQFRNTLTAINQQLQTITTHHVSPVQYLDQVLDYAPVGIMALAPDFQIISCNQKAGDILEQSERDLRGSSLIHQFPAGEHDNLEHHLSEDRHGSVVLTRPMRDGDTQHLSLTVSPLPLESGEAGAMVIMQDVTAQVVSERERESALQLRDEFLSIAAHELKTPLTSIKGYVELLGRQLDRDAWNQERIRQLQGQLNLQVERLELLISDLLDVSHVRSGAQNLRLRPVNLADIARVVLRRFEGSLLVTSRHQISLDAPTPVVGHWDPDLLDHVVTNLVSNALKYSPDGGLVSVAVTRVGAEAHLVVSDQGIGIGPELKKRLYQPFTRGEPQASVPGTGLGLHITSRIVDQHGGAIELESEPGHGSTFTVRLPLITRIETKDAQES